nr:uncharacterized protein I303_00346 [Kwoniella dejecticola CBS 10117]OBR88529.1 hypothetical protein I303_00346 [Kwoniella dejecticola CBS 10117]
MPSSSNSNSKPRSRSSSPDSHQNSPFNHILCLLLSCISTLFLFLVILYNIPFAADETGDLDNRLWLVKLSTRVRQWGFTMWGWCSWSSPSGGGGGGGYSINDAQCTRKSFWSLPADAPNGLESVNLPSEIAKSLSISGFLLTFLLIISFALMIDLLITLRFHSPKQPPAVGKIYWTPPRKMRYTTWVAYCLRNFYLRIVAVIVILAWGLPVIVVAAVGVEKFNDDNQGYIGNSIQVEGDKMSLGSGWIL